MTTAGQNPLPKAVKYELLRTQKACVYIEMLVFGSLEQWVIVRDDSYLPKQPDAQGYFWFVEHDVPFGNGFLFDYCWKSAEAARKHWETNREWIVASAVDKEDWYGAWG